MSKVRERILETASELFYRNGIQAVGVDAIIGGADVARMSFYRHFKSKEGLVLAFLERRDDEGGSQKMNNNKKPSQRRVLSKSQMRVF